MFISKPLLESCLSQIGLALDEETLLRFDRYARLLTEYNEKVNLTAITDPDGIVVRHFADSLYLLKELPLSFGMRICDVGTGAGCPGVCLLLASPGISLTLMDSVNKKLEFLRFLLSDLGLQAEVLHVRAEEAGQDPAYRASFDVVTARAVAQLNILSEYCVPLVKTGGRFAPLKAPLSEEERRRGCTAAANLGAVLRLKQFYTLPDGSARELLLFEKKSQTPTKYPRNAAQIAKKPL